MTAPAVPGVGVDDLEQLAGGPLLCTLNEHRDQAVRAVAVAVFLLPCHPADPGDPVCDEHAAMILALKLEHRAVECGAGHPNPYVGCACSVIELRPLPA